MAQLGSPVPSIRAGMQRLVQVTAQGGLAPLLAARARCRSVGFLPWHPAARAAREAYLVYLDARLARLLSP